MVKKLKQMDGTYIYQGDCRCGFLGLMGNILVIKDLLGQVKDGKLKLEYLLFYKSCQDRLEFFFSAIRLRNGWCMTPTSRQFRSAFRQLLQHASPLNLNMNGQEQDEILILKLTHEASEEEEVEQEASMDEILPELSIPHIKSDGCSNPRCPVCQSALANTGGYIVMSASRCLDCSACLAALHHQEEDPCPNNSLIMIKSYEPSLCENYHGKKGLTIPSGSVVGLITGAERWLSSQF